MIDTLKEGSGYFPHGQTYRSLPPSCAAALEVQVIIKEQDLVVNVAHMGVYLENLLRGRLADHPHVGDIRGRGLFWIWTPDQYLATIVSHSPAGHKAGDRTIIASKIHPITFLPDTQLPPPSHPFPAPSTYSIYQL